MKKMFDVWDDEPTRNIDLDLIFLMINFMVNILLVIMFENLHFLFCVKKYKI